jgi:pyruvate-formate lyase-activating enzyme
MKSNKTSEQNLDRMGFYTMTDQCCQLTSTASPMRRAVVVVTEKCNFRCPYCRTFDGDQMQGSTVLSLIHDYFRKQKLFAILFTGGEPTVHPKIVDFVEEARQSGIQHIGLATNGSASPELYKELWRAGVDDFSISLDADNPRDGAAMSGGTEANWERIIINIRMIASLCRVTIGLVVNEYNINRIPNIINFAKNLGVHDIRVNPAAQFSSRLPDSIQSVTDAGGYPILNWRISNLHKGLDVRGLDQRNAPQHCWLVQDETAISGDYHYPCFVYMREGGMPIGRINDNMRDDRWKWMTGHDPFYDPICRSNCPDCCVAFNQQYEECHDEDVLMMRDKLKELKSNLAEAFV